VTAPTDIAPARLRAALGHYEHAPPLVFYRGDDRGPA